MANNGAFPCDCGCNQNFVTYQARSKHTQKVLKERALQKKVHANSVDINLDDDDVHDETLRPPPQLGFGVESHILKGQPLRMDSVHADSVDINLDDDDVHDETLRPPPQLGFGVESHILKGQPLRMDSVHADSVDITLDDDDLLDETLDEDISAQKFNGANGNHDEQQLLGSLLNPGQDEIQDRLKKIEEEAQKTRDMQSEIARYLNNSTLSISSSQSQQVTPHLTVEEKADFDARSVYVGNVEYAATPDQLEEHFRGCGPIERVTILSDKFSGHPKGFAYIQFTEIDGMQNALALDESLFLGRQIKVSMKRTNKPGFSSTNRPPRGRGIRGRGGVRGFGGFRGSRGRAPRRRGFAPY